LVGGGWSFCKEHTMAFVRVEQRSAHLAGAVRLMSVQGRDGPVSKATLTAISNTRRGGRGEGDNREDESTAIQWTLWGKQAENAAQYLSKGSHVNVVGRVQNNNYERDGETVYSLAFTAEEIDYLDSKADGEALRARQGLAPEEGNGAPAAKPAARAGAGAGASAQAPARNRRATAKASSPEQTDDIPF
jgi:single-strand DNA-binding protein